MPDRDAAFPESDADAEAAAYAFLARYLRDADEGAAHDRAHYEHAFPDHAEIVRNELNLIESGQAADTSDRTVGRFQIIRELGRGGQAVVYLAYDPELRRQVAIKVFMQRFVDPERLQRFKREAAATARIDHPGICPVFEVGQDGEHHYFVMKYVEGKSLAHILGAPRSASDPYSAVLEPDNVLAFFAEAARAIHAAHAAGIVHRDLKPGNIIVGADRKPVILDFGLARDETDAGPTLTQTGDLFGTPAYMSPEQIRGDRTRIDARTDVYSLGAALFECVTGRRPFEGATRESLYRAILAGAPASARALDPRLSTDLGVVIGTAIAADPDHRYQTAEGLAEDLRRVRAHEPIVARPVGRLVLLARWFRLNPALGAMALGSALLLVCGLVVALVLLGRTRDALTENIRLADFRLLPSLERAAQIDLWPLVPATVPAIDAWLAEADSLVGRLALHKERIESIQAEPEPGNPEVRRTLDTESDFVARLEKFPPLVARIRERREVAASLEARTVGEHRARWEETITSVADQASFPIYRGLALPPQLGLVPLGRDPDSGLFEFAHVLSGALPSRDPKTGKLAIDEDTGIVLVLVPGGPFRMGSNTTTMGEEWPSHEVTIDAFFISKFEMTQAQWMRATGEDPSFYVPGTRHGKTPLRTTRLNPVEMVTWHACRDVLGRLDLELPTEAQWEFACRAGSTTLWYSGDTAGSLLGFENIADEGSRDSWSPGWMYEPNFVDSQIVHSPVGTFRPNALGLHDMVGNVSEWCRDLFCNYSIPPRPGDGLRDSPDVRGIRVYRGGNYSFPADYGRSSARKANRPDMCTERTGVRASRAVRS